MWTYSLILFIIGIICVGAIFYLNSGTNVEFINLGFYQKSNLPLNVIIFWVFIAGLVYGLLFAIGQEFRLRRRITRLKKENKEITEELNSLRVESIKEAFTEKE